MLHQVQITVELLEKLAGIRPKPSAKQQQKQSQLHQQAQHQQQQQLARYAWLFPAGVEVTSFRYPASITLHGYNYSVFDCLFNAGLPDACTYIALPAVCCKATVTHYDALLCKHRLSPASAGLPLISHTIACA